MDSKLRKRVLRQISNGVYVLTSAGRERPAAATITWLTQFSFDPPLLVAGIRPGSSISESLQESRKAVVHIVGSDQLEMAKRFFSAPEHDADATPPTLAGLPYEATAHGPLLQAACAWAQCQVLEIIDSGGDHNLVVLEVIDIGERGELAPLTVQASPWSYGG